MNPSQNSTRPAGTFRTTDAKLDKANKPKAPTNLVLPKPVRIPPPPGNGNSR